MHLRLVFVLLMVIQVAPSAYAVNATSSDVVLPETRVVASPIIEGNEVDRYGGQVTRVGKEQIRDMNAPDLPLALRKTPGVNISRYNNLGAFAGAEGGAIFIRGMGSSRPGAEIKTFVDGAPKANALFSHPLMDLVPVDPAQDITVYKGANPLYFGDAFGAVNVGVKRMSEPGFKNRAGFSYGSFNTFEQTAESMGKHDIWDYYFSQSYRHSDGHREKSEADIQNYHGRFGVKPSDNLDVTYYIGHINAEVNDPGRKNQPATREGRYQSRDLHQVLTVSNRFDDFAHGSLKAYWSMGQGNWYGQSGLARDTLGNFDLFGVKAREAFQFWPGGEIVLGSDFDFNSGQVDFTFDNGTYNSFNRETWGLIQPFMAASHMFGSRDGFFAVPSAGGRLYAHTHFEPVEIAPQAGLVLGWKTLELHGLYSRGVNYPGMNVAVFAKNVIPAVRDDYLNLRPEIVEHFESGLSFSHEDWLKLDYTVFADFGSDRYALAPSTGAPVAFRNVEKFTTYGMEATATVSPITDLSLFLGVAYLERDPDDLPYAPRWSLSSGANYTFLKYFRASVDAQYVDEQYVLSQARREAAFNVDRSDPYFLLNAKLAFFTEFDTPIKKTGLELYVAGTNLTDSQYAYRPGYPMPGIGLTVGGAIHF